jgi:hypothetical protein
MLTQLLFLNIFLTTACINCIAQNTKTISVDLTYLIQPGISKTRYTIKLDTLTITDLKGQKNKDSILYKSPMTEQQISEYNNQMTLLNLDTLEQYYDGGGFDGFDLLLKINSDTGSEKIVGVHNYKHPVIKVAIQEIIKLIPLTRHKIIY